MNGYSFSPNVRNVLARAREESARLHHEYVGTEHILLGLIRCEDSTAVKILRTCEVDTADVGDLIEATVKKGKSSYNTGPDLPYTSRAKKVLELSMAAARDLGTSYVGTEHLILGLLNESKGIAAQVLADQGLSAEKVVAAIHGAPPSERPAPAMPERKAGLSPWTDLRGRLKTVFVGAHELCKELRVGEITPIHIAIALLELDAGAANAVLRLLRFDRGKALAALRALAPPGDGFVDPMRVGDELASVLRRTQVGSNARAPGSAGTQDLLLGLLEESSEVRRVFADGGVTADQVRDEIQRSSG